MRRHGGGRDSDGQVVREMRSLDRWWRRGGRAGRWRHIGMVAARRAGQWVVCGSWRRRARHLRPACPATSVLWRRQAPRVASLRPRPEREKRKQQGKHF